MFVFYPVYYVQQPVVPIIQVRSNITQRPQTQQKYDQHSQSQSKIDALCHKIEVIDSRITKLQQSISPSRIAQDYPPTTPKQQKNYFSDKYDPSLDRIRISRQLLDQTKESSSNTQKKKPTSYYSSGNGGTIEINKNIKITKKFIYQGHEALYEGQLDSNGKRSGMGSLFDQNGRLIYTGMWRNDIFHGKGKLIFHGRRENLLQIKQFKNFETVKLNKVSYNGNFVMGEMEGIGSMQFQHPLLVYYGSFHHGKFHGRGCVLQQEENNCLEGEWNNGMYINQ